MTSYDLYNPQIHRVIHFEIVSHYTIRLTFEDQTEQTIDFEPVLSGSIFGPLKDKTLFDQVTLEQTFGTLEWPNGADISPMVLYEWPEHKAFIIARRQQEAIQS